MNERARASNPGVCVGYSSKCDLSADVFCSCQVLGVVDVGESFHDPVFGLVVAMSGTEAYVV